MTRNQHIAAETFTDKQGREHCIAHPVFVPVLFDDLREGLDIAIDLLKAGHVHDVMRAYDYALAAVCFPILKDAEFDEIKRFVDQPAALYRIGWHVGNDEADLNLATQESSLARYFRAREAAFKWYTGQVWQSEVKSKILDAWAVPSFEEWIKRLDSVLSSQAEYDALMTMLNDPEDRIKYLRACSLAWLERVLKFQEYIASQPTRAAIARHPEFPDFGPNPNTKH
jgi:hypothetical protein